MSYAINRAVKRALQSEYRRQSQRRTGTVKPVVPARIAGNSSVAISAQVFPAAGVQGPQGAMIAVKNVGRPANAVYAPDNASSVVYSISAASVAADGGGGDGPTYTAGNGIQIVSDVIATKNKSTGAIAADGSGNYLVVPATSGLTVDATGVYVGAGDGISVLAHSVAVNLDTNPGLEFISGKVRVKVDSTMVRGASGVGVNTAHVFGWTAEHTFNAETNFGDDLQVGANIDFIGGNRSITGSNSVTIAPATDLILDPGGVVSYPNSQESRTSTFTDSVTGILGFRMFDNSSGGNTMQLTANSGKFDNLFARKFQADEQRVARGSWFLTYSYGIVETSFVTPAIGSTVDVWFEEAPGLGSFKLFSKDHWILFRFIDIPSGTTAATIWFQAVDADGASTNDYITRQDQTSAHLARQQWRLKRMSGGATGITVNKGETAGDFALPPHMEGPVSVPGQGIVYATSLYEDSGPYIQIQTFESVVSNVPQFKNRVRMGNLSGTVDYTADAWGLAAGDDLGVLPSAGFSGVAIDAAAGTRLFNTDIVLYQSSIPTVKLVRDDGLMFRFDDVGSDNDPLRMIAWFDDLNAPSRTLGDGWSYILSTHYDQGGGNYVRLMKGELLVPEGVNEEGRVSWQASNYDTSKFSSLFLSTKNTLSDGGTGSASALSSDEVRLSSYVVVGAAPGFTNFADSARLHVYDSNSVINKRAGLVIQQQGSGDAVLHWYLSGTSDTHKWWSAGIDHTGTVPQWKLSASDSLGTSDFIVINPATGTVTINGLDGGSAASGLTGGDGITISGSSIAVNSSVARTTTHVIAGNGLTGGGTIDADRTLAVLLPTTSGLSVSGSGLVVADSLAGDGLAITAKVMSVDSTVVRTSRNLTAGDGLSGGGTLAADRSFAVDATVVRTTRAISAGDGLSGGGTLAADRSFAVDATVVRISRTITSGGGLTGGGDLSANRTLAVGAGDGITVNADDVAVDGTVVRTSRTLTAGDGLSGGGTLAADRSFAVDATVVRISRTITSGGGLTGGGDLSANRTLAVGAGDGITVNADDVAVDGTVVRTSRVLTAGNGLTGGGSLAADRTFDVGAGNGISVAADAVAVDQSYSFAWTGVQSWSNSATFNGSFTVNNNLHITGTRNIDTDSTNPLTIMPGGNLILSPGSNAVLPTSSYQVNLGDYNRKWKTLYLAELYTETLVAQSVMATIGGRVMVAPTNTLTADCASSDTSITVKYNNFTNGTYIMFEAAPAGVSQFEVMKVTTSSPTGGAGAYVYTVTRNQDGTGANAWVSGDACVSWGSAAGQGYIDLTSTTTAFGSHSGPTVTTYVRTGTNWNDIVPVVSMGNLKSFVDYGSDEYGQAIGNDLTKTASTGFSGLTSDRTNGLRLFNTDVAFYVGGTRTLLIDDTSGIKFQYESLTTPQYQMKWVPSIGTVDVANESRLYAFRISGDTHMRMEQESTAGGSYLEFDASSTVSDAHIQMQSGRGANFSSFTMGNTGLTLGFYGTSSPGIGYMNIGTNGRVLFNDGDPISAISAFHIHQYTDVSNFSNMGLTVSHGSAGDAVLRWMLSSSGTPITTWAMGIDNSDSDKLKISKSAALGTNDAVVITTGGLFGLNTSPDTWLHVEAAAVTSAREIIAKYTVSDDSTSALYVYNATSANSTLAGAILGQAASTGIAVSLQGTAPASGGDSGTSPLLYLVGYLHDGNPINGTRTAVATRPLLQLANNSTTVALVNAAGQMSVPFGYNSYSQTINDDGVLNITLSGQGFINVQAVSTSAQNYFNGAFRALATPFVTSFNAGTNVATSTSTLTGTTGTDGKMTISATNGHVYIENRLGSNLQFMVMISTS